MRRSSPLVRRERSADMDSTMTPMIDVVFLLLVFFVWTASFQVIEHVLTSEMKAEMGSDTSQLVEPIPEQDFDKIVIRIRWDGRQPTWTVRDQPMKSIDEVRSIMESVAGVKPDAPIILHPDSVVPLGYVIEAYDVSKQVGFQKVSFAVNPSKP
jgi:biopolymer transport protein ExbD